MLRRLYDNPAISGDPNIHPDDFQQQFDDFYEDIFEELSKYGEIEEMNVCDNACGMYFIFFTEISLQSVDHLKFLISFF